MVSTRRSTRVCPQTQNANDESSGSTGSTSSTRRTRGRALKLENQSQSEVGSDTQHETEEQIPPASLELPGKGDTRSHRHAKAINQPDSTHDADVSESESCCSVISDVPATPKVQPTPRSRRRAAVREKPESSKEEVVSEAESCASSVSIDLTRRAARSQKRLPAMDPATVIAVDSGADSCSSALSHSKSQMITESKMITRSMRRTTGASKNGEASEQDSCSSAVSSPQGSTVRRSTRGRRAKPTQPIPIDLEESTDANSSPLPRNTRARKAKPGSEAQSHDSDGCESGPSTSPRGTARSRAASKAQGSLEEWDSESEVTVVYSPLGSSSCSTRGKNTPCSSRTGSASSCRAIPVARTSTRTRSKPESITVLSADDCTEPCVKEQMGSKKDETAMDICQNVRVLTKATEDNIRVVFAKHAKEDVSALEGGVVDQDSTMAEEEPEGDKTLTQEDEGAHDGALIDVDMAEPETDQSHKTLGEDVSMSQSTVSDVPEKSHTISEDQECSDEAVAERGVVLIEEDARDIEVVEKCFQVEQMEANTNSGVTVSEESAENISLAEECVILELSKESAAKSVQDDAPDSEANSNVKMIGDSADNINFAQVQDAGNDSVVCADIKKTVHLIEEATENMEVSKEEKFVLEEHNTTDSVVCSDQTMVEKGIKLIEEAPEGFEAAQDEKVVQDVTIDRVISQSQTVTVTECETADASTDVVEAGSSATVKVTVTEAEATETISHKAAVVSLLDSSDDEDESDGGLSAEDEVLEQEEDDSESDTEVCTAENHPGPSERHVASDGLFVIDTRPGHHSVEEVYVDRKQEEGAAGEGEAEVMQAADEDEEEFIDEEGDEDEDTEILMSSRKPALTALSSRIDPGLKVKELGGLYISFDGRKSKNAPNTLKKMKDQKNQDKLMKQSIISPDMEKKNAVPYVKNHARMKQREENKNCSSEGWFKMKAPNVTAEMRNDFKVLQMRSAIDPKRFYKKNDRDGLPKYFQVGTVVDNPADFYHSRIPKKERKRTMVEELLADAEFRSRNKKRCQELASERAAQGAGKRHRKPHKFHKKRSDVR